MLFGRLNEIAAFDNSRWQTIVAPGTRAKRMATWQFGLGSRQSRQEMARFQNPSVY
jgi:hypothetical protein